MTLCEQLGICPHYDVIVVGAGISGLYAAREILKKYPTLSVALAERYKGLGGRTYSYSPPEFEGIHWEMGAGRIHKSHKLLMNLIKEYKLHWVPIGEDIYFKKSSKDPIIPNEFESIFLPIFIKPLTNLSTNMSQTHTIQELLQKVYGESKAKEILSYFPYRAEVTTLRADLALKGFFDGGEMSSHKGYGILAEGFGELVSKLREDIEKRGCTILQRHKLINLEKKGMATDLHFEFGYDEPPGKIVLRAKKAVLLALHKDAISEISAFKGWKTLEHLQCEPLLRTYAIFPSKNGKSWFSGMTRVVTPERPRYIIPMNPSKGVIMISYTDADDTKFYTNLQEEKGDKVLEAQILKDVRSLFPEMYIPKPLFFRSHPWKTGATYWTPGTYSPKKESINSVHPLPEKLPNVWLCGESWSLRQAWVEGALEQTELCLEKIKL